MVFSSVVFLFLFLPIVYIIYIVTPSIRLKNIILIIASLIFYAYGEPKAVVLMLISILANYGFALIMDRSNICIFIAVVFNVLLLFVFKYLNFFADSINYIFGTSINIGEIHLPIGISFFTFQAMSYVIDVYRKDVKPQKNLLKLMLYISFFPQLIAGPIIKYHDIEKQLDKRDINTDRTASGLKLFIFGLSAKLIIANTMGSIADTVFSYGSDELFPLLSWIGAIAYTLQIYFDFSGYSSMAIGLGRMFGFDFAPNFNLPFISKGIKEFWRRWHISLSTWFREYVYIPLGGNRRGKIRTAVNQLIVFTLTGLWHGANVTFLVWGLIHGVFLVLESSAQKLFSKIPNIFKHIYTMLVVILAFVIFRADTVSYGIKYIGSMIIPSAEANISRAIELCDPYNITIFVIGVLLSFGLHIKIKELMSEKTAAIVGYGISVALFALCIINISASTYDPFIYFRF